MISNFRRLQSSSSRKDEIMMPAIPVNVVNAMLERKMFDGRPE